MGNVFFTDEYFEEVLNLIFFWSELAVKIFCSCNFGLYKLTEVFLQTLILQFNYLHRPDLDGAIISLQNIIIQAVIKAETSKTTVQNVLITVSTKYECKAAARN